VQIRDLVPEWVLAQAYAFRRGFLLRRHRYPLTPLGGGRFQIARPEEVLPHRRVLLDVRLGTRWGALELRGAVGSRSAPIPWEMRIVRSPTSGVVEMDLPYGLRDLVIQVHPAPGPTTEPRLEIQEVGWLAEHGEALGYLATAGLAEAVAGAFGGGRSGRRRPLVQSLQHSLWTFEYRRWLRAFEAPPEEMLAPLRRRVAASGIRLGVVLDDSDPRTLEHLASLLPGQLEVCRSLEEVRGDAAVLLGREVVPAPHALLVLAASLLSAPDADLFHADDDRVSAAGERSDPSFKPRWSPEQLLARNYLRGLVAIRRSAIPPGFQGSLGPARRYGFVLSCAETILSARIVRVPFVLASRGDDAPIDTAGEDHAVHQHLEARGITATLEPGPAPGLRRVRYPLPAPVPRVSIIVPTRNASALVQTCVESVRRLTAYPDYEILLVDNGSDEPRALELFDRLASSGQARLLRDARPFNFAALNNQAVTQSSGSILCLLNNDIEALHADWLEEMVSLAIRPGVGAVGAKLLYPDLTVQHAGVLVGFHGAADHLYAGFSEDSPGLDQQLWVRREVSAVTAACLVVRRGLYEEVGGLDAERFPVAFNDVDFCLRLRAQGLRNLWTPHARLIHHESASRGRTLDAAQRQRAEGEIAALRARWASELREDPYHSPNLTLDSKSPRLAWPPRARPPWIE
jgi:GT2 family glycosyltransferase